MKVMWYATDRINATTSAIIQFDPTINGWLTLSFHHPHTAEKEVERRNNRLREVYRDNGIIVS